MDRGRAIGNDMYDDGDVLVDRIEEHSDNPLRRSKRHYFSTFNHN